MISELKEKAYAKVNFNLEVLPKRADGFHSIHSIFQTIDLFDQLTVTVNSDVNSESKCVVTCDSMELPVKNTISSAYEAFCEIAGCKVPGINVKLVKGIPSGGGLGGGSSDAAALIRMLQKICSVKLSVSQLDYIAGKTGSDVFFFMHCDSEGKGCALVSGRGEIVKSIKPRTDLYLLLIFPEVSSSTKEAYELVDSMYEKKLLELENDWNRKTSKYPEFESLEHIYRLNPEFWTFINTFTPVLCEKYVAVNKAIEALKNRGTDFADMSGSGSTVYGVYAVKQQADKVTKSLAESFNCKLVQLV